MVLEDEIEGKEEEKPCEERNTANVSAVVPEILTTINRDRKQMLYFAPEFFITVVNNSRCP